MPQCEDPRLLCPCGDPVPIYLAANLSNPFTRRTGISNGTKMTVLVWGGRPRCADCYLELSEGVLPSVETITGVPHDGCKVPGTYGPYGDEPSPWDENAIRALEGD